MRTTVTLDKDVEKILRDAMHRTRKSFKDTLNSAIRAGLSPGGRATKPQPFVVKARPMGLPPGIDPTSFNKLNDELEADAYLKTTNKLARELSERDHS